MDMKSGQWMRSLKDHYESDTTDNPIIQKEVNTNYLYNSYNPMIKY